MPHALDQLHRDHDTMSKLLDVLERQVGIFVRGNSPDYEIIQDIVEYFLDYPDLCHHPREDAIARLMIAKGAVDKSASETLIAQHEELGQLTRRFAKLVQSVVREVELSRGEFLRAAREFIDTQRHHMAMEDKYFFPSAEKLLDEADWAVLEAEEEQRADPLLGSEEEARFKTLREEVLKWGAA